MKTIKQLLEAKNYDKEFEPHMMYDPKTGKGYKAEKPEDHERMKKMGYSHDKPEIKEDFNIGAAFFGSFMLTLAPFYYMAGKALADDLKRLKAKSAKKGFKPSKEDKSLLQKLISVVKRKKPDVVSKAMKKANESVELDEAKSSSGYELYHRDFSGAMQHAYAHAKKKGFIVDKDDVDHKVAMGPKRPSSGKTNKYILDTNKKQKLHVQVANLDNKRYELNMYIESVEDFDLDFFLENARAKRAAPSTRAMRDARKGISFDPDFKDRRTSDIVATDDDRKAASKNVLMQIRKLSDLPKGGEIEFEGGKKGKISQDDASKVVKMFNTLKKPQDKAKFQKVISKDLKTIQGLLKRLGR